MDTDSTGEILIASGRPLLIAAPKCLPTLGRTVVIAWKETAEAARAVGAAMPLLVKAGRVIIAASAEGENGADSAAASAKDLAASLRWHGIEAETRGLAPRDEDPHSAVFQMAKETGADLLVMGGYGRSRLRELVFGGFTRAVLNDADLPVLLAH